MLSHTGPAAVLSIVLAVGVAKAEEPQEILLQVGEHIRIQLESDPDSWIRGKYMGSREDSLILQEGSYQHQEGHTQFQADQQLRRIPWASVSSAEVITGTHGNAQTGALIGFGIGAAGGVAAGIGLAQIETGFGSANSQVAGPAIGLGLLFGIGGALAGALIGSDIRSEDWQELHLPEESGDGVHGRLGASRSVGVTLVSLRF